jgi:O-antigen/teichoic acid export membrane protein
VSSARTTVTGGSLVALGMVGMNVAIYGFNLIAARVLDTRDLGALTALFGILLVGTVSALGLQAVTARRLAIDPAHADDIVAATLRVTLLVAVAVGAVVAAATIGLTPALKLDSSWPVILCGGDPVRRDPRTPDDHGGAVRYRPGP